MKKLMFLFLLCSLPLMAQTWKSVSIDSAESLSGEVVLDYDIHLIQVVVDTPWTDADLTFQVYNEKDKQWEDVFGYSDTTELVIDVDSTARKIYAIEPKESLLLKDKFRFRSGTAATPVEQGDARTLTIKTGKIE